MIKVVLLFFISFHCLASPNHSIFITNHAETKHQNINPSLSQCGRLRAKQLSTLLSHAKIKHVYSTSHLKNMETANPTAQQLNIPVKVYTPKLLDSLAVTVMTEEKNVLVIADESAIKFLIQFISKNHVETSRRTNQHLLYQIHITANEPTLTIFQQPLTC